MANEDANHAKTEDLVSYIVDRLSGRIGRTMVLKLLYLTDLEARRYLGHPITHLEYRLYFYGPFDAEIYRALELLRDSGEIAEELVHYPAASAYRYSTLRPGRTHNLSRTEEALVAHVLNTYAPQTLDDVLDTVYDTEPMRRAQEAGLNSRIPMECVDNEMRISLGGIDLERALAAEDYASRRRSVPWIELRRELLDRSRRAGS